MSSQISEVLSLIRLPSVFEFSRFFLIHSFFFFCPCEAHIFVFAPEWAVLASGRIFAKSVIEKVNITIMNVKH